jgi:hypothetical protein
MVRRLSRHVRQNAVAWLALFVALGGTGAYAANTIGTGDIIDDQVTSADVRDDTLGFGGLAAQDLGPGSVRSSEVLDSSLIGADIADSSITGSDVATGSIGGLDIADNSLTGTDINESTLNLPPTTTATFAGQGNVQLIGSGFTKIVGKTLPAGSYAIAATANIRTALSQDTLSRDTVCELRNTSGAFIGGGGDRRPAQPGTHSTASISMNGGVQVPAGGGEVGLYCRYEAAGTQIGDGQMMIIRLDGFF